MCKKREETIHKLMQYVKLTLLYSAGFFFNFRAVQAALFTTTILMTKLIIYKYQYI